MPGQVIGIGGVFFRAEDPDKLKTWYDEHFGTNAGEFWAQAKGQAVFAPFKQATDYWPDDKQWMINFRVDDLAAITERLEAAGIPVRRDADWDIPTIGKFGRVTDPEGNAVELWEPDPEVPE